jgi:hypothetical protein
MAGGDPGGGGAGRTGSKYVSLFAHCSCFSSHPLHSMPCGVRTKACLLVLEIFYIPLLFPSHEVVHYAVPCLHQMSVWYCCGTQPSQVGPPPHLLTYQEMYETYHALRPCTPYHSMCKTMSLCLTPCWCVVLLSLPPGGSHPTDVRMTTRFKEEDLTEGLTGAIHETGEGGAGVFVVYQGGSSTGWPRTDSAD